MPTDDQISALERLTKLRDTGALNEEEFASQKASILSGASLATPSVPFYRRLWLVVTLTCLIIPFWVALLILITGQVYKRAKDRSLVPIKGSSRFIYAGLLTLWLAAIIGKAIIDPISWQQEWRNNAPRSSSQSSNVSPTDSVAPSTTASSTNSEDSSPNIQISEGETQDGQTTLTITADDDNPFTIERLVYNDRAGEKPCYLPKFGAVEGDENDGTNAPPTYGKRLPNTMKRGDQAMFFPRCGATMTVTVYTDRGSARYKIQ
jgi:hypothetical protein